MSPYPKCPVCKHPHSAGTGHIWEEEISRESAGREVAVSASDPVTVGSIKREDEAVARQGDAHPSVSAQYSQPSQSNFDRKTYQREYMRDLPKAKAEGLTVKAWRKLHGL